MIIAQPLTAAGFAPFGDVIETGDAPVMLNNGTTERHHDLAPVDLLGEGAHTLILPNGTFGVTAYGYNCDVSYAYPGGLNLLQLN